MSHLLTATPSDQLPMTLPHMQEQATPAPSCLSGKGGKVGGGSASSSSLIESLLGLPSYQESFAVDPNEVLSKNVQPKKEDLVSMEEHPLDFLFNTEPVR